MTISPLRRWLPAIVVVLALAGFAWWWTEASKPNDPQTVASASLEGLREQQVLVPFVARYVAVVTSTQSRLGGTLSAKKTLIMPGEVRYELDLSQLQQDDLVWNEARRTLSITLPALRLAGPEIDMKGISEYQDGELLLALTDAEAVLDKANRERAAAELLRQAKGETPMRLARRSAADAVERSFAMPLRAAGIEAKVIARFPAE